MTQEQIVERGLKATEILENESLMSFFLEQMDDIKATSFDNTDPAHTKEREKLFFMYVGVKDFIERMKTYREAALRILEDHEEERD